MSKPAAIGYALGREEEAEAEIVRSRGNGPAALEGAKQRAALCARACGSERPMGESPQG